MVKPIEKNIGYVAGSGSKNSKLASVSIYSKAVDITIKDGMVELTCEKDIANQIVSALVSIFDLKDWDYIGQSVEDKLKID